MCLALCSAFYDKLLNIKQNNSKPTTKQTYQHIEANKTAVKANTQKANTHIKHIQNNKNNNNNNNNN